MSLPSLNVIDVFLLFMCELIGFCNTLPSPWPLWRSHSLTVQQSQDLLQFHLQQKVIATDFWPASVNSTESSAVPSSQAVTWRWCGVYLSRDCTAHSVIVNSAMLWLYIRWDLSNNKWINRSSASQYIASENSVNHSPQWTKNTGCVEWEFMVLLPQLIIQYRSCVSHNWAYQF